MNAFRTVSISEDLCAAAELKFAHRFSSIDELVGALLKELLRDDALTMDEEEQRIVEERLKGLGYV